MFPIKVTHPINENALQKGIFLWVTHTDKIPPHIGISVDGNYFSLQVSGKDDCPVEAIMRAVRLRRVPSLFVELAPGSLDTKRFLTVKNDYVSINESVRTCLIPVLDLFGLEKSGYLLPDFLKYLEQKQLIVGYFALNLPSNFGGIKSYSLEDVTRHLNKIKDAERAEHISPGDRTR